MRVRTVFAFAFCVGLTGEVYSQADEIEPLDLINHDKIASGDQALVNRTLAVTVLNQKEISNGHRSFGRGNICHVEERSILTMLEPSGVNEVMVRLDHVEVGALGTNSCPGKQNVAFRIKRETFVDMKLFFAATEPDAVILKRHGIE